MSYQRLEQALRKINGDTPKKTKPKPKPHKKPENKVLSNPPGDVGVNRALTAIKKVAK